MEGTAIGTYRVLKKLGEGGMGAVYLAEHSLLGRRAAIKVLQPELSRNQDIVQRFFNEARAATAIADPGIVQIFDFGYHTDGSAYIVMELLEGEPVDARLRRLGRLAPADALRILRQVASSLAAAHARGIVHRDLKPENIYLVVDREVAHGERPKLLDFGIAKLTGDTESKVKTHTAAIMGTPMYMSPEQCRGAGHVDFRSDLYSLGCVLYHLLVGRPPFDGEGVGDIIACHLRSPAPLPSASVPGIPPEVDALTLRLMAKAPEERFASATELAEVIGQMLGTTMPPAAPRMPSGGYVIGSGPPTTLSGSAGHLHVQAAASVPASMLPRKRRAGLWAGVIAGVAIATVVVVVVAATGTGKGAGPAAATSTGTVPGTGSATGSGSVTGPGSVTGSASVSGSVTGPGSLTGPGSVTGAGMGSDPGPGPATATVPEAATATGPVAAPITSAVATPTAATSSARASRRPARGDRQPRTPAATTPPPKPSTGSAEPTPDWMRDEPPSKPLGVPGDLDGDGIPETR